MKRVGEMTQAELGAHVQSHLIKKGIDAVLSGGAVVAIYTSGKYISRDLDLVNRFSAKRSAIRTAMEELGFSEVGRHFEHPDSEFLVEFPPGPLSLGRESVTRIDRLEMETGELRIISPTDCVKDRLAGYYHWQDRQSLAQALLVAKENEIDLSEIEQWSKREGKLDKFEDFRAQLASTNIAPAE